MPYDPYAILLMNFGRYAKDEKKKLKKHLPSVAQIPLMDFKGFSYVDGFLSNPEETDRIDIANRDLEYIHAVASAFGIFPAKVKCEGAHGSCGKKELAESLVLPWDKVSNHPEKIKKGGPERVNQVYVGNSLFCCEYCADIMFGERKGPESGIILASIGFRLPDSLTDFKDKKEWNVNRGELHRKMKEIAYQFKANDIGHVIDPASVQKERMAIDKYDAQRIASRMLGIPEGEIPKENKKYAVRNLGWRLSSMDRKGQYSFEFKAMTHSG